MTQVSTKGLEGRIIRKTCDPDKAENFYEIIAVEYIIDDVSGDYRKCYTFAPNILVCIPKHGNDGTIKRFNINEVTFI